MTFTPREQAAVEAACRAVRAHRRRSGGRGRRASRSAADVLEARLDGLDWDSFRGRGYRLLREVYRRVNGHTEPEGGSPGEPKDAGIKYEERYDPARRRLARASA